MRECVKPDHDALLVYPPASTPNMSVFSETGGAPFRRRRGRARAAPSPRRRRVPSLGFLLAPRLVQEVPQHTPRAPRLAPRAIRLISSSARRRSAPPSRRRGPSRAPPSRDEARGSTKHAGVSSRASLSFFSSVGAGVLAVRAPRPVGWRRRSPGSAPKKRSSPGLRLTSRATSATAGSGDALPTDARDARLALRLEASRAAARCAASVSRLSPLPRSSLSRPARCATECWGPRSRRLGAPRRTRARAP